MKKFSILFFTLFLYSATTFSMEGEKSQVSFIFDSATITSADSQVQQPDSLEQVVSSPVTLKGINVPKVTTKRHKDPFCASLVKVTTEESKHNTLGTHKKNTTVINFTSLQQWTIQWFQTTPEFANIVSQKAKELNKNIGITSFLGGAAIGCAVGACGTWLWLRNKK